MPEAVPAIYSPRREIAQIDLPSRFGFAVLALGCLFTLCVAAWLKPNPTGMSTHVGLHLQPCEFLNRTGLPCPSCGMTTSFAHFARGNLAGSFYVQPMGCLLAILAAATFWISGYIAVTGRPVQRMFRLLPTKYLLFSFLTFAMVAWVWKIFIYRYGLDGW